MNSTEETARTLRFFPNQLIVPLFSFVLRQFSPPSSRNLGGGGVAIGRWSPSVHNSFGGQPEILETYIYAASRGRRGGGEGKVGRGVRCRGWGWNGGACRTEADGERKGERVVGGKGVVTQQRGATWRNVLQNQDDKRGVCPRDVRRADTRYRANNRSNNRRRVGPRIRRICVHVPRSRIRARGPMDIADIVVLVVQRCSLWRR